MAEKFLNKEGLSTLWSIIKEKDLKLEGDIKQIVNLGYFYENEFYTDQEHLHKYVPYSYKLYIEISTHVVYAYINNQYVAVGSMPGQADETHAGIAKLYDAKGANTDGSMTQKSVTNYINDKVGAEIQEELLVLTR